MIKNLELVIMNDKHYPNQWRDVLHENLVSILGDCNIILDELKEHDDGYDEMASFYKYFKSFIDKLNLWGDLDQIALQFKEHTQDALNDLFMFKTKVPYYENFIDSTIEYLQTVNEIVLSICSKSQPVKRTYPFSHEADDCETESKRFKISKHARDILDATSFIESSEGSNKGNDSAEVMDTSINNEDHEFVEQEHRDKLKARRELGKNRAGHRFLRL